jgi:hypothetical protein
MAKPKEMPTSPTHREICEALWNLKPVSKKDHDRKKKKDSDESDG